MLHLQNALRSVLKVLFRSAGLTRIIGIILFCDIATSPTSPVVVVVCDIQKLHGRERFSAFFNSSSRMLQETTTIAYKHRPYSFDYSNSKTGFSCTGPYCVHGIVHGMCICIIVVAHVSTTCKTSALHPGNTHPQTTPIIHIHSKEHAPNITETEVELYRTPCM